MSQKLSIIWNYLAHYKYLIVIIAGVLIVGVIDDNSIRQHIKYQIEIATLRSEIEKYRTEYDRDLRILQEMRKGPEVFGKIARERYFMKADNEDIFVPTPAASVSAVSPWLESSASSRAGASSSVP